MENYKNIYLNIYDHPFIKACLNENLDEINSEFEYVHEELKGFGLRIICGKGNFEICKFLIEKGVNIDFDNFVCLRQACFKGHINIIKYLVELGSPIETLQDDPLIMSYIGSNIEVMKWLISNGCKFDKEKLKKSTKSEKIKEVLEGMV